MKTLIKNVDIITMGSKGIIKNGALGIDDDKITTVGTNDEVTREFKGEVILDGAGKVAIPGLICVHTHATGLTRGVKKELMTKAPAKDFFEFLSNVYWPYVEDVYTKEDAYIGTKLSCLEMIREGITTFTEVFEGTPAVPGVLDNISKATNEAGLRAYIGYETSDAAVRWGDAGTERREKGYGENLSFAEKTSGKDVLVKGTFSVHAPYTCTDELLLKSKESAEKLDTFVCIHLGQSPLEDEVSKRDHGLEAIEYLDKIGFLGSRVLGAHCVWFSEKAINLYSKSGAAVAHSPIAAMVGGMGRADIPKFLSLGTRVGLGNDGGASYKLAMFEVMKTTLMLHRVFTLNGGIIRDPQVMSLATIDGARVLRSENMIGSLEQGKKADVVLLDFRRPRLTPSRDILAHVVNAVNSEDVDTVIVNGKILMQDRVVKTLNESEVLKDAQVAAEDYWKRAGL